MTKEEAKQLLPILQAFAEGKTIQYKDWKMNGTFEWKDLDKENGKLYSSCEYRLKPEPKYRPFKDAEECWQEMQKHQPFGWIKYDGDYLNITSISDYDVMGYLGGDDPVIISFKYLELNKHPKVTFVDGTPFGIKEEN